ncbi:hypothetical protein C8R42DRAFT_640194 [Lentinula raphanica]|nr:hypothetical protein C8R42DRAFT_640194 [Lentinula raphanica]
MARGDLHFQKMTQMVKDQSLKKKIDLYSDSEASTAGGHFWNFRNLRHRWDVDPKEETPELESIEMMETKRRVIVQVREENEGVTDAYEGVTDAYEGVTDAYEGVTEAYEGVTEAYEGVTEA